MLKLPKFTNIHLRHTTRGITKISAACLIIGDEILTGKTIDTNSHYLAKKCFNSGIHLERIITIPDIKDEIASTIQNISNKYDYIFTSGGVGPTHDDITYESIAFAFNLQLEYHPPTIDRMKLFFKSKNPPVELNEARKRMGLFPSLKNKGYVYYCSSSPTKEIENLDSYHQVIPYRKSQSEKPQIPIWIPIVRIENVHILPGIPFLFEQLVDHYFENHLIPEIAPRLPKKTYRKLFATFIAEGDFSHHLTLVSKEFEGKVRIGSYPNWRNDFASSNKNFKVWETVDDCSVVNDVTVVLSFEGEVKEIVELASERAAAEIKMKEIREKQNLDID